MDFTQNEFEEVLNIFRNEGLEILQSMDGNLLMLEKEPENNQYILQLFRDAHSLKGSARMLGFNTIQSITHKIEDIIGLFKEKKVFPFPQILETISNSLEYIQELIEKTFENQSEYTTPAAAEHIKALEEVVHNQQIFQPPKVECQNLENVLRSDILIEVNKIDALIIEIIFIYSKLRTDGPNADLKTLSIILNKLKELKITFEKLNLKEVVNSVDLAIESLNTTSGENFDNIENIQEFLLEINSKISDMAHTFSQICAENNIQSKNYYECVAQMLFELEESQKKPPKTKIIKENTRDHVEKFIAIIQKLEVNVEILPEVKMLLAKIIQGLKNDNELKIFTTISNLFQIYEKNNKPFEKDTLNAIYDVCYEYLQLPINNQRERIKKTGFLIQRVQIVEKISQINVQNIQQRFIDHPKVPSFNSQDWFDNINTNAIKTLRIDSHKLDNLVNQIGELIVTRIKNTEQLPLARHIQNDCLEWQKSWHKVGHFIKYFDKKYLSDSAGQSNLQNILSYNKQLISLYNTHNERIYNIFMKVDTLYRQLQENDVQLNSITNDLETMVKSMRILPLATIFHLFPRMVHNIAKDKGKEVEFRVQGSEVSADKKIIEDIKIPLMHILRNSIDHGIETPRERESKGKKRVGEILVSAFHKEDKIIITIKDDGKGLDVEKIKARALEKGFLTFEEINTLPEDQIVNLIFYPGFSTGDSVTDISGRGLGLDIVHTKISQLNGRIDVCSEYENGTITTIELPATMATIKAFVVLECSQFFAFPASSIKTVTRISTDEVFEKDDKNYFIYNEKIIPIFTLSQILQYENVPRKTEKFTLLIIESDNAQLGIIVEKLIGEEEILHKKLPQPFLKVKNISGITTLANGKTSLILNVTDILNTTITRKTITKIVATNNLERISKNKNYKILVVDDSLTTRTLQKNIIESHGYWVQIATNALDALSMLKYAKFDLIVTDNEMPEMNGLEFVKEVKSDPNLANIPIIVLTSNERSTWVERFNEAGADKFMQKSEFNQEVFMKYIYEFLK